MYRLVMSVVLLFPWLVAIHIAVGAFCAARRRTAARKQIEEGNPMKLSKTLTQLICAFCVPALILSTMTFPTPVSAHTPGLVLLGVGTATKDGNHDGLRDLICDFRISTAAFQGGDTLGILKGQTVDGAPFIGTNVVRVVP